MTLAAISVRQFAWITNWIQDFLQLFLAKHPKEVGYMMISIFRDDETGAQGGSMTHPKGH